jgi:Polyketide cyclase / dehydrase and lipid transport
VTVPCRLVAEHVESVSVERVIAAPPGKIFDVLADPSEHPVIDGSGTVKDTRGDQPARLSLGAKFGMSMRLGIPYVIKNTVVEFEEGRLIAWRHFGGHRWRYELEPVDGGTKVRETYDWSTAILGTRLYIEMTGRAKWAEQAMIQTLERLDAHVTGSA